MNKTYLIFRHEFRQSVLKAGYFILTLIVPVLALLGLGASELISSLREPAAKEMIAIGYVDQAGVIKDPSLQATTGMVYFHTKPDATNALINNDITEYIIIPVDYKSSGRIERFILKKEASPPPARVAMIKQFLTINLLGDQVPPDIIALVVSPIQLEVTRLDEAGNISLEQSNVGNIIVTFVFALLLSLGLMIGSTTLVSGLGEEKESRLIEVLFSSVSIRQLLVGKVMALGLAGLIQVLVWLASTPLILSLVTSASGGAIGTIQIPIDFFILGIAYYILGYLLFAVLSIGIGAISSNAREGGQLSMIYTMMSFIPLWFSSLLFIFPDGSFWTILTLFPITAPIQTILRMGVTEIPLWQIISSLTIMVVSIFLGLYFSIRIFTRNMLMQGKRKA